MSAREPAAVLKQLELTGFQANKKGQQTLLEIPLFYEGGLTLCIGSIFGYHDFLNLRIMLPRDSSIGEMLFPALPSLLSYDRHVLRFMKTLDCLNLSPVDGIQSLNKDEAIRLFTTIYEGLSEWSKKLEAPNSLNRFQEQNRNQQLLPFYLAGMTPSMASYALHRRLPAFHPVVLAVNNRTLSPIDVDRKQLLIIPPMKLPKRIKANSATMEPHKGMVPVELPSEDIHRKGN